MKTPILALVLSALAITCKQEGAVSIDQKLVDIYAELIVLNEQFKQPSNALSQEEYQQKIASILQKYNTTRGEFTGQIQALSNDQGAFRQFTENVNKKLQEFRNSK